MATLSLPGAQLSFALGGSDRLSVDVGATSLLRPLTPDVGAIFRVGTDGAGQQPLTIDGGGWGTIAVRAGTTFGVTAVWPSSEALVAKHRLGAHFAKHPDDVVLVLDLGGSAGAAFAGPFTYAPLMANLSLDADADFAFTFANAYRRDQPLNALLTAFFRDVRLPPTLDAPPGPGEIVKFEYGGYLTVGASIGVGYSLQGTPSIALGQLQLSEACALSVVGTLGLTAKVAGFFGVEMRAATDAGGRVRPGWTQIVVRKRRSSQFTCAADVSVGASSDLELLPGTPNEFVGALLGVNVKNWLNLLDHVRTLTDWNSLRSELDDLAVAFLTTWAGEGFDRLSATSFPDFVARVQQVVDASRSIDGSSLSIVDRYFDSITSGHPGDAIARDLERLAHLPSWADLQGDVSPPLWQLVTQLTDGDPLGWIASNGIELLRSRAADALALGEPATGGALAAVVKLAKQTFGIDPLVAELGAIDTTSKLKASAGTRAGAFIERLLGADSARLHDNELGGALARVRQLLERLQEFEQRAHAKFVDVVKQNVALAAHVEYSQASETDALIDIAVDTTGDEGRAIVHDAALGDFSRALSGHPRVVEINRGRLTHNIVKQNAVSVNVVGWHAGWHYQGIDRVVVGTDQQIVTDAGALTIYTTTDLSQSRERRRTHERTYTNLLLRFIGESSGAIARDPRNEQYLIDSLTGMSAAYDLAFDDDRTTLDELSYYLSFASAFGIAGAAIGPKQVAALLPSTPGNGFGAVSARYSVRYDAAGLRRLFTAALDEPAVRKTMRRVVLSSYLRAGGPMAAVGWAYWTPGVFEVWKAATPGFVMLTARELEPIAPPPFPGIGAPKSVVLDREQQRTLDALYNVEQHLTDGFMALARLVRSAGAGRPLAPHEFESALSSVGDALAIIDDFGESVNTTFAVFDTMLRDVADAPRASTLTLESQAGGRIVTKVFFSAPANAHIPATAGAG